MSKALGRFMTKAALIAFACAASFAVHAVAEDLPRRFDVPAGDLATALQTFAKQAGVEFVSDAEELKGLRTKGVVGVLSPQEAVEHLLEGTRLRVARVDDGAFLISAQAGVSAQIDVAAQPLAQAIQAIARQTSMNILVDPKLVEGRDAPALKAQMSVNQALNVLLQGTGLTPRFVDDKTITLVSAAAPVKASEVAQIADLRLAQSERSENPEKMQKVEQGQAGRSSSMSSEAVSAEADAPGSQAIPEVLVKGSKILNMDIRRDRDGPQPWVVFERDKIQQSGVATLEDFLKQRLPMNTQGITLSQGINFEGTRSQVNLRGLGSGQTLILIDGRRVASAYTNNSESLNSPNLNSLPVAAIERVEILPTTASGIYGGNATGGVINIITRRDYRGAEFVARYENTVEKGAAARNLSLSAGYVSEDAKTTALFGATYSDQNGIAVEDREFARRARASILTNNPAFYTNAATPPLGATTNIRSADGTNLVLRNGTALGSPITFVPTGYQGPLSDGGAALVANAGAYNFALANTAQIGSGRISLLNAPERESVAGTLRRQVTARLQTFVEASMSNDTGHLFVSSAPGSYTLPSSAPNNPFMQAIRVTAPIGNADGLAVVRHQNHRAAVGLIVDLPRQWTAALDYTWNHAKWRYDGGSGLSLPTVTAISNGTLDVLRDLDQFPLTLTEPLVSGGYSIDPFEATVGDLNLRLSGSAFTGPGGPVTLNALLELRKDKFDDAILYGYVAGADMLSIYPDRSQDVSSAYLEAQMPFISERNSKYLAKELRLQLAARADRYSVHGVTAVVRDAPALGLFLANQPISRLESSNHSINPTIAASYKPVDALAIRASYGTGFLPPTVNQMVPAAPVSLTGGVDPRRGNQTIGSYQALTGGNSSIQPEESQSWSAGVVFTPQFLPSSRLSIDYTNIRKTQNIVTLSTQQIVDNESVLGTRVTRGANLPGDPAGWPGPIIAIDRTAMNIATARVEAFDLQLDYRVDTSSVGSFALYSVASWQTHYRTQLLPTSPTIENVGRTSNNPLEFKASAGISWQRGQWTAGWNGHFFDSYFVGDPASPSSALLFLNQGSRHVGRQSYHDFFVSRVFDSPFAAVDRMSIDLGVKNAFNSSPPFDAAAAAANAFYSPYGDPRLVSYYASLRVAL